MGQWAGRPFEPLPWQADLILRPLFGWKRDDGTRRYRQASIWIAKKNGKSTLSAALALYLLAGDGEPGSQVFCAASDRIQAGIVFNEAASMCKGSPVLASRVNVYDTFKSIKFDATNSVLRALSGESGTNEGINAHGMIFDELHAQPDRRLFDTLRYAGAARRQPLLVTISTAGYDRNSIGWEQYDYAKKVAAGELQDDGFLPVIFEALESDDWKDEATWRKANPSLGETVTIESMREAFAEAQHSPQKENAFRRYRLNQWTQQEIRWIPMDRWAACRGVWGWKELAEQMRGRECFAGLDLATTHDLTALSLVFPEEVDGAMAYTVVPFFWIPADNAIQRSRRDRVPYEQWTKEGVVYVTDGDYTDYGAVRKKINELAEVYRFREIAVDRWGAANLITQLAGDGHEIIAFQQGFSGMAPACAEFESALLNDRLAHGDHPVLTWNAGNVAVQTSPEGHIRPSKKRSRERIDGIVATLMGIGRASVHATSGRSIYDDPGNLGL